MKKTFILLLAALCAVPVVTFAQKTTVTRVNREKTYKTSTHSVDIWYQGELNVGFATGGKLTWKDGGDSEKTNYSRPFISTIHGARITQYGFVGLGVGVQYAYGKMDPEYDDTSNWETLMIPVFLNLKGYYPVTEELAPYISISLGSGICATSSYGGSGSGYGSSWKTKLKGGFYGEYGIGLNYRQFNFGLGLQHQSMKFSETYDGRTDDEKASVNSFFVKVGLKF